MQGNLMRSRILCFAQVCFAPVLTSAIVLTAATSTQAADIAPVWKSQAGARPYYDWSGFYAGGYVGFGTAPTDIFTHPPTGPALATLNNPGTFHLTGLFGGLRLGSNFRAMSGVIFGIEVDVSRGQIHGDSLTINVAAGNTAQRDVKIDWVGTARGRVGYTLDNVLIFGTGGAAWLQVVNTRTEITGTAAPAAVPGTVETSRAMPVTWTIGGGAEVGLGRNWAATAEYLYIPFKNQSFAPLAQTVREIDVHLHVVRFGLNRRF